MFDRSRCISLCYRWIAEAPNYEAEPLKAAYKDFDADIASMEQALFQWEHDLRMAKNIAYEVLPPEAADQELGWMISTHLRDAGRPMAEYRKCHLVLGEAYGLAADLFAEHGNEGLASNARENGARYRSGFDLFSGSASETTFSGWFEQPKRTKGGVVALDYPAGKIVVLAGENDDARVLPFKKIDLPEDVVDVVQSEDSWYFVASKGTVVIETDSDFRETARFELDLDPALIARHFGKGGSRFACTQFDNAIHFFDKEFCLEHSIAISGVDQFRRPIYDGNILYVFNFDNSRVGLSDLLSVDVESGRVWCLLSGLDVPTIFAVDENGKAAIGDCLGVHIFNLERCTLMESLNFEEIVKNTQDAPYCNGIEFTESGIDIYIMFLYDFSIHRITRQKLLHFSESIR